MKRLLLSIAICFISSSCSTEQSQWIAIGDSITYLNEHKDETGNRVNKGYLTRVVEKLHHIKYVNKGYNGWKAVDIAKKIETLDLFSVDIYSVMLGTNDWWHETPLGTFEDYKNETGTNTFFGSYRVIINKLRALNKNARIILMTPIPRGDFVSMGNMTNNAHGSYKEKNGQLLSQFAEAVATISEYEKMEFIDLWNNSGITHENIVKYKRLKDPQTGIYKNYSYPEYVDIPFNPETDEYPYPPDAIGTTYDALHPSDSGNAIIAKKIIDVINN